MALTNVSLAEETAEPSNKYNSWGMELNFPFPSFQNAAALTNNEPKYANLSGNEIKFRLPSKSRFIFSFGAGWFSESWGEHDVSLFGATNDKSYKTSLNDYFLELTYLLGRLSPSDPIDFDIGLRLDYLNLKKDSSKIYVDPSYTDQYSSFYGSGYMILFPFTIKRYYSNILLSFSYSPGLINVPVSGNINGIPSTSHFIGSASRYLLGITFNI